MKGKYLILGSNLGDPESSLQTALEKINSELGRVVRTSSVYVTEPWGLKDQPPFYNQVVEVKTELNAYETLEKLLEIETSIIRQPGILIRHGWIKPFLPFGRFPGFKGTVCYAILLRYGVGAQNDL